MLLWWRISTISWLEWPSTHQCTIQKILLWDFMDGMKLATRGQFLWSVVFFFAWALLFSSDFLLGSSLFFLLGYLLINYFFPPPLTPVCFLELLPTPPTYLPHSGHLSFVLVLCTIVKAWDSLGLGLGFRALSLQSLRGMRRKKRRSLERTCGKSFIYDDFDECQEKRSYKVSSLPFPSMFFFHYVYFNPFSLCEPPEPPQWRARARCCVGCFSSVIEPRP